MSLCHAQNRASFHHMNDGAELSAWLPIAMNLTNANFSVVFLSLKTVHSLLVMNVTWATHHTLGAASTYSSTWHAKV